jgi:phenylacetic acid degradation operon negative regulatory protein
MKDLESGGLIGGTGTGPLDERLFRITRRGRAAFLGEIDPEALWTRTWDGVWRLAMFDVPQVHASLRTRLRRKLRELRFGWLQNSVWLSPDPVSQLIGQLTQKDVTVESLFFIEGRPAGGETDAELVAGAWDFAELAKQHATYLKLLRTRPSFGRQTKSAEWSAWLESESRAWRAVARRDPFLPAPLLPADYAGRTVWQARRDALHASSRAIADALVAG